MNLSDIFKQQSPTAHTTPMFSSRLQKLPNDGGLFKTPVVSQKTTAPVVAPPPVSSGPTINPAYFNTQGGLLSPDEYANNVANKLTGRQVPDIPKYAGDQFNEGPQTVAQMQKTATDLNNTRNDLATGETDPYKIGSKSGLDYSPEELRAIEKAYAGVYDPALTSALSKLEQRQKEDAAALKEEQDRKKEIFRTDENIRQYRATTGLNKSGSGSAGSGLFTKTQTNKGASNAGMEIEAFKALDQEIKNFYINPPKATDLTTGKSVPAYKVFRDALKEVEDGTMDAEEVSNEIMESNLPDSVKQYFIDQMPLPQEVKQGYFERLWAAITGN